MIHSGYPVMNPWSINVKVVLFWGGRRSLFQTSTKGSFCLRASQQIFTSSTSGKPQSSFLLRSIPMYDRVGMLEKRRLATEVWGGCPDVLEIGWSARVNNSSYLKFCWICVDVASFMANLLKAARLSATWKRPNLSNILLFTSRGLWFMILPARGTGGHGHAKFWGSGCEGGTSRLGQIMGNSSGNVIWVTYETNFSFKVFLDFFRQKNQQVRRFCLFQNPSHQFFGHLLSSGSCCNRDAGSHCIGRSHGSKFQPSKDTSTQLGASHVRLHETQRL